MSEILIEVIYDSGIVVSAEILMSGAFCYALHSINCLRTYFENRAINKTLKQLEQERKSKESPLETIKDDFSNLPKKDEDESWRKSAVQTRMP